MERRIIMCRRHPVLAFDDDPSSGKAVGSGRILDCSRLPLELISHGKPAIYAKSIDAWWRRRAIPPTRDGIRGILDSMGISIGGRTPQPLAWTQPFRPVLGQARIIRPRMGYRELLHQPV